MTDRLPSPSGARLSGDDYQHAVTWLEALRLLQGGDVTRVRFEVGNAEAGIVDDLVVERAGGRPSLYKQIKFGVDDTDPLTAEWFTTPQGRTPRTPLQRFYESYKKLSTEAGPPELELLTVRQIAPDDPLLKHRSNRDGKLARRAPAAGDAQTGELLEAWREHLDINPDELADFLEHLKISPGRGSLDQVIEHCGDRMRAAGLKGDETAVLVGVGIIRGLIGEGTFDLDPAALRELIDENGMATEPRCATLLIQELDHRAHPELATASVDWVDDFIGDDPDQRRRPTDDETWNDVFLPDLRRAAKEIRDQGHQLVRLDGDFRLPTAFALGRELNERSNVQVVVPLGGDDWSSAAEPPEEADLQSELVEIDGTPGVAVAVSIAGDIAAYVEAYIREETPGLAGKLLAIEPASGPGRHSVAGAGEARAMAEAIVDAVRGAVGDEEVHLFMSCPRPLAVFLGRVWNRVPSGWVYADLNPGYAHSYRIEMNPADGS